MAHFMGVLAFAWGMCVICLGAPTHAHLQHANGHSVGFRNMQASHRRLGLYTCIT
jgi:hypothetical protein